MWPPWGNHKGCPYDAVPQRDFFTPSQPWVQKALWFAGAPAGRKKRFRRGNSPWLCRPLRGLTGAWAWFPRACEGVKKSRCRGGPCGRPGATTRVAPTTRCHNAIFSHLLAPWAKFYRPLGGLRGRPCWCRRKLSQICHAPAAGLPPLCRAPDAESASGETLRHLPFHAQTGLEAADREGESDGALAGGGVIWDGIPFETPVIPAKAGIQSVDSGFLKVCRVDSRFRGNDCGLQRPCLANDISTRLVLKTQALRKLW